MATRRRLLNRQNPNEDKKARWLPRVFHFPQSLRFEDHIFIRFHLETVVNVGKISAKC